MASDRSGAAIRLTVHKLVVSPPPSFQVWFGNVPSGCSEADLCEQLVRNKVPRPTKLICRKKGDRPFAIGYFANQAAATSALHSSVIWSSGVEAEIRRDQIVTSCESSIQVAIPKAWPFRRAYFCLFGCSRGPRVMSSGLFNNRWNQQEGTQNQARTQRNRSRTKKPITR